MYNNNNNQSIEIEYMNKHIHILIDELNKNSKIMVIDKLNNLRHQRIHQAIVIRKLTKKIKNLKNILIIIKNIWIITAFEKCETTIQEFDFKILPISENIKKTEYNLTETESILLVEKIKIEQIDNSYKDIEIYLANNFI